MEPAQIPFKKLLLRIVGAFSHCFPASAAGPGRTATPRPLSSFCAGLFGGIHAGSLSPEIHKKGGQGVEFLVHAVCDSVDPCCHRHIGLCRLLSVFTDQ